MEVVVDGKEEDGRTTTSNSKEIKEQAIKHTLQRVVLQGFSSKVNSRGIVTTGQKANSAEPDRHVGSNMSKASGTRWEEASAVTTIMAQARAMATATARATTTATTTTTRRTDSAIRTETREHALGRIADMSTLAERGAPLRLLRDLLLLHR